MTVLSLESLRHWAESAPGQRFAPAPRVEFSDTLAVGDQLSDLARTDKRRALRLASALVEIVRVAGREADLAVAKRCRALAQRHLHRYGPALRDYHEALALFVRCDLPIEAARTEIGLVETLSKMGRYREAIPLARRARLTFERAGETGRAARIDVNLGNLFDSMGRYRRALVHYEAAEAVFEPLGLERELAMTRYNRARVLVALDRPGEALPLFEASATLWEAHSMTAALVQCRLELGSARFRLGRLVEALDVLERARQGATALGDRSLMATSALELARIEVLVNREREAEAHLDDAIASFDALLMRHDQADATTLRAMVRLRQGLQDSGLADLAEAKRLYRHTGNRPRGWWIELRETIARRETLAPLERRKRLRGCIRAFRRYRQRAYEAEARLALAESSMNERGPTTRDQIARAEALLRELGDPWLEFRVAFLRARTAAQGGRFARARRELERAFRAVEMLRRALPLEAHRAHFLADKMQLFEQALALGAAIAAPESSRRGARRRAAWAFRWSERAHAPLSRDAWHPATASATPTSDVEKSLLGAIARAREEIYWLDEKERTSRLPAAAGEPASRLHGLARWRTRRSAAAHRLERLFHRFELQAALRYGLPQPTDPDPERVRAALADDETLIEYFVGHEGIHAFLIDRHRLEHLRIPAAVDEVETRAHRLKRLWERFRMGGAFRSRFAPALDDTAHALLDELRGLLLDPLVERLPAGHHRLTVVPHRWLRGIPFHAFPMGPGVLADRCLVRYALSAQSLVNAPALGRGGDAPLVIGHASPEAPAAEREAIAIGRAHGNALGLVGDAATPEAVRARWSRASLIHVASHAGVCADDPRLSGLRLAGGEWSTYDLYATPTSADVVVLGGCQTGEAVLWGGDDSIGLLPALFQTGARAAIVSAWSVDDRVTEATMLELHRGLAASASPWDALHASWTSIRSHHSSPYSWAPFALYGAGHI